MSNLTQKQEKFCLTYIETGNASAAYRSAYDASGMNDNSINRKAFELMENVKITARIGEIRAPAIERAQITLETHLEDLKTLRDKADASEKYGPAIAAEIARGKASGLYVEETEITGADGGPILTAAVDMSKLDSKELANLVASLGKVIKDE